MTFNLIDGMIIIFQRYSDVFRTTNKPPPWSSLSWTRMASAAWPTRSAVSWRAPFSSPKNVSVSSATFRLLVVRGGLGTKLIKLSVAQWLCQKIL